MSTETRIITVDGIAFAVSDKPKKVVQVDLGNGQFGEFAVSDKPKKVVQVDVGDGQTSGFEVSEKLQDVV